MSTRFKDIGGTRYGRLVAISFDSRNTFFKSRWLFACDCGNKCVKTVSQIKSDAKKSTPSCGCYAEEVKGDSVRTHGRGSQAHVDKTYRAWASIKMRCYNPNSTGYERYGGRGITVSPEWVNSFEKFLSDMGERPEGYSIERKDVNGPYSKENCCWIPRERQAENTRQSVYYLYNFEMYTQASLAKRLGVSDSSLYEMSKANRLPIFVSYLGKLNNPNR